MCVYLCMYVASGNARIAKTNYRFGPIEKQKLYLCFELYHKHVQCIGHVVCLVVCSFAPVGFPIHSDVRRVFFRRLRAAIFYARRKTRRGNE